MFRKLNLFYFVCQHWIGDALVASGTDYISYLSDIKKPVTEKTMVDGIQLVIIAQMLGRNITLVTPENVWCSDSSMLHDIVIVYTGTPQKQFFPTQVGN